MSDAVKNLRSSRPSRLARVTAVVWGLVVLSVALNDTFRPPNPTHRPLLLDAFLFVYVVSLLAPRRIDDLRGVRLARQVLAWAGAVLVAAFAMDGITGWVKGEKHPIMVPISTMMTA